MMFKLVLSIACLVLLTGYVESKLPKFFLGRNFEKKSIKENPDFPEQYFDQILDHFKPTTTKTWKQRYWVNEQYFNGEGPVFIMIGGEGAEDPAWMSEGQWIVYAQQYNALCVMLEHRFYGESKPTEDLSTENLVYLNSRQALADLANFRQFIHESYKLNDTNKWVSFGGSYPGALSAWFRLKYPHLVHAAVASSGPVNAVFDFSAYLDVVTNSLGLYSNQCVSNIKTAYETVNSLIETADGKEQLQTDFNTCDGDGLSSDANIQTFYSALAGNFMGVVQYNPDNSFFRRKNIKTRKVGQDQLDIKLLCDTMNDETLGDEYHRLIQVTQIVSGGGCIDANYNDMIQELSQTNYDDSAAVGYRQWIYQTCNEFGYYQTTDSPNQPFGDSSAVPLDFYIQQCENVFGFLYTNDFISGLIDETNTYYGGLNFDGSRVVFVNGEVDPWHALSIFKPTSNKDIETVFIKGTSHCADMLPSKPTDSAAIRSARIKIGKIIGQWLNE